MLALSRQSIRRRGIRASSQEYENLVTLRQDTESFSPSLCPTSAVSCAVCKWAACPATKSWLHFSGKEDATELWLLLTASEYDFSWIPLRIFQHVSVTGPLKSFFAQWPPSIKRMLNIANYICCSVLNWVHRSY